VAERSWTGMPPAQCPYQPGAVSPFFVPTLQLEQHVEKKLPLLTEHDNASHPSPKDSTRRSANPTREKGWASMVGIGRLLAEVTERLHRRPHVRLLTAGWDKRIGIVAVDTQLRWQLTFSHGNASWSEWQEEQSADLVLHGHEKLIHMLLEGDELQYISAKQQVRFAGTVRDQLKLDAILRLTSK